MSAYRSGLELKVAEQLKAAYPSIEPVYERYVLAYTVPERIAHYTPDFVLPNGIVVETKGRFLTEDRQKHLLIKQQFPELDIRFVFTNSRQKLYKGSKTSYGAWCVEHGFQYADRLIPLAWLREGNEAEVNARRAAVVQFMKYREKERKGALLTRNDEVPRS